MSRKGKPTRSRDGWVRGHPPEEVAEWFLSVFEHVGGSFTRKQAGDHLLEIGVHEGELEAVITALLRVPGVKAIEYGRYMQPGNAERAVRHRAWRITPRRLDIEDASRLHHMLERHPDYTPNLASLREQLAAALEGLD